MLVLHRKHKYRNSIGLKVLIVYRQIRLQEKKKKKYTKARENTQILDKKVNYQTRIRTKQKIL